MTKVVTKMSDSIEILDIQSSHLVKVSKRQEIERRFEAREREIFIAPWQELRSVFASWMTHQRSSRPLGALLLVGESRKALRTCFRIVVGGEAGIQMLPADELREVLTDGERSDRVIGGVVYRDLEQIVLYRGSLESIAVPFSTFRESGDGTRPRFDKFSVGDYGQTLKFGGYEASVDAVLFELDPHYRKRAKARLRERDSSLGASLRRLRLTKGLKQTNFSGISSKEIGRLERVEIAKPHDATLKAIAKRLGVSVEELGTF